MSQAGHQCVIAGCDRELTADDDLGVCPSCSWRIAQRHRERFLAEERRRADAAREVRVAARARRKIYDADRIDDLFGAYEQPEGTSFVYYVRIGDHIKIGYSGSVLARLSALRVPIDQLLALEPGGRDEEQARHRQFDHLRITRRWENFHRGHDLEVHIAALRDRYGLPKWLRSPRRGRSGPVEVRQKR